MSVRIYTEEYSRGEKFEILGESEIMLLKNRVRDAVNDIADNLEEKAKLLAPESSPEDKAGGSARWIPSGTLKMHPVDVFKARAEGSVTDVPLFGGGFALRAPAGAIDPFSGKKIGGQFLPGVGTIEERGHVFFRAVVSYPQHPFYAKYVAFGTPDHGPRGESNMIFYYNGRNYNTPFVHGQDPQPYLKWAAEANEAYVEIKMSELRREVDAIL